MKNLAIKRHLTHVDNKKRITRRVLLIQSHHLVKTAAHRRNDPVEYLWNERRKIEDTLEYTVDKIERETGVLLPRLGLDWRRVTGDAISPADALSNIPDAGEYRALGDFSQDLVQNDCLILPHDSPVSHFVVFSQNKTDQPGWYPFRGPCVVRVNSTATWKFSLLIIDVVLDTAMFHYWSRRKSLGDLSIQERRQFSRSKAQFAKQFGDTTYYGPVWEDVEYVSLASVARKTPRFHPRECRQYVELWGDFIKQYALSDRRVSTEELVHSIIRQHRRGGSLRAKHLKAEIEKLEDGEYVLLLASKYPRRSTSLSPVLNALGIKQWKANAFKILTYENVDRYLQYWPWITFFRFSK